MKYLLDTHTWVWWNIRSAALSPYVKHIISTPQEHEELLLSAISVWEVCKIFQKNRLHIATTPEVWIDQGLAIPKLRLVPLTPRIAYQSTVLPDQFHQDPADQIIVATAREEGAVILTKDEKIRGYEHVRTVW